MEEITVKKEIERKDLEVQSGESEDTEKTLPWQKQITLRGIIASLVIGSVYSIITMKLNLTTGLAPNLNVSAGLLAYVVIQTWTKMLQRGGFSPLPFTKQENTMIQTCIVACYSIAYGGGFASYLLGLNKKTYELAGVETEGNSGYKEPGIGWMTSYSFLVCFVGLFVLIPLRKILIIDYKLIYPSGTATAVLINGFHSRGDKTARKQVRGFLKFFSMSFFWGFFQWFFQGKKDCGFSQFPTFGLQAWKQTFFFDFSMTYVGAAMICTHLVNLSLLLGAVLSYGIMWPLISKLEGDWFPANMPEGSMRGLTGYKVFICIALILGDGLYNFVKVLIIVTSNFLGKMKSKNLATDQDKAVENLKENRLFLKETISMKMAVTGYLVFSIISTIAVPLMFPELKWYYVVVAYIIAPALSFCNAYGAGLTDINMAYNYGKVALFIIAAMSGKGTGVVAGLVGCGLMKSVISISCILMHDFKAGHLTLSSPRSMLLSQAIGTALGSVIAPLSFFLFYKAFDVGNPKGEYKAPYALIYRNMAILGVEGFSALPRHCLQLSCGFFAFAVGVNLIRDLSSHKIGKWMPLPMVMGVPFLTGAYFAIDMCVGSLVVFVWQKVNPKKADLMVPAVASGLLCGEGLWIIPSSILALAKVSPPICMKFVPS